MVPVGEHIGAIRPNPDRHEAIVLSDEHTGHEVELLSLGPLIEEERADDFGCTAVAMVHGESGEYLGQHEVLVPKYLTETGEHRNAVLQFTDRHRRAVEVGAAALTFTIAVGSLMVVRRAHKK